MKRNKHLQMPLSLAIAFSLVLITLDTSFTQEKVAGKLIKTGLWNGREIRFVEREVAVKIMPSITAAQISEMLTKVNATLRSPFDVLGWGVLELPEGESEFSAIAELEKLPFVLMAHPNTVMKAHLEPNDPYFQGTSPATYPYQWALKNTHQSPPAGTFDADIDAPEAWDITTGNSNVVIAILDSGIPMQSGALSHPDLDDPNKIELGSDYIDLPGTQEYQEGVRDRLGHGTHVAGIAAAESNNGTGIAGVAWNCRIRAIQVFNAFGSGLASAFRSGVIEAVDYQRNNPGEKVVINFSGGQDGADPQLENAVSYANTYGVLIVASAGNDCSDPVEYPAAYSSAYSNVMAVSATNHNDVIAEYSNVGPQVNVTAPGGHGTTNSCQTGNIVYDGDDIYSTTPNYPFNIQIDHPEVTQSYGYLAGTSMAAPHVAGTAALMLSVDTSLTASQIRNLLQENADDKGPSGFDNQYGYGRINAYRTVKAALPQQFVDATFNSSTTLGYARLQGTTTIAANVTITVAAGQPLVIEGTVNGSSNALIRAYGTLIVDPGATINNVNITIESGGRMVANGTSATQITFDFITPSSSNGIKFNSGSSGSLTYCTVKNATNGITCNNVLPTISYCSIRNNSVGISCYYSSPHIDANEIFVNNTGIFCYSSSPWIYDNIIDGDVNGIYLIYNSPANIRSPSGAGFNRIYNNHLGIYADYQCNAFVSGNDVYINDTYAVSAAHPVVVQAQINWWGQYPPDPNDFYASDGAQIFYLPGAASPFTNPPLPKISGSTHSSSILQKSDSALEDPLSDAIQRHLEGKYEEAIALYMEVFREEKELAIKQYILAQLAECYRLAEKNDFIMFCSMMLQKEKNISMS